MDSEINNRVVVFPEKVVWMVNNILVILNPPTFEFVWTSKGSVV